MSGKQGSLISMKMVREFMMPCYDRIARFAKRHGVRVISVDTDGDCSELVPLMMEHGVNVLMPFEVQAGNDILEYHRQYPTLGIMGGLDKRALARGRAEIDAEVGKARRMIEFGRYIPGFDHLIPPDVPWENMKYAAEWIREVCMTVAVG
jgi:uroporphyrinogen decarboxylase